MVDEVEEVPRRDGHDAAASLQRPLVGSVQRLVNVNLEAAKIQLWQAKQKKWTRLTQKT